MKKLVKTGKIKHLCYKKQENKSEIWLSFYIDDVKFSSVLDLFDGKLSDGDIVRVFYIRENGQNKIVGFICVGLKNEYSIDKILATLECKIGTHAMFSFEIFAGILLLILSTLVFGIDFASKDGRYFLATIMAVLAIILFKDAYQTLKWFRH